MSIAIKVENLSKAYQLGEIGTGTISRDLERWLAKLRGKEDPFLKIGETNNRSVKGNSDIVWSLKDINFDIQAGQAVGIIGRNGAGKSTLLKLLSRVTAPTIGAIKVKGRVASLLEVGTGFHPELTGRENVFLNGAILGMRKKEIASKFDEIVDFAGVERYVDTPVKRYSSGMYVRLAFAVAAHLESEILIVDEVLAVGDAEFQAKCLGKMGQVSKNEGRTVLFVSHNMEAVKTLCQSGIVLKNGETFFNGDVNTAISKYTNYHGDISSELPFFKGDSLKPLLQFQGGENQLKVNSIAIVNSNGEPHVTYRSDEELYVETEFEVLDQFSDFKVILNITDNHGDYEMVSMLSDSDKLLQSYIPGTYKARCKVPSGMLATREYKFDLDFYHVGRFSVHFHNPVAIEIEYTNPNLLTGSYEFSKYRPVFNWDLTKTNS